MILEALRLVDFRNYRELEVRPAAGLNVLVGSNAQGKSNLLEAIAMLATGKSFRARREREVIRWERTRADVVGSALVPAGSIRLHCTVAAVGSGTRKSFSVNGASVGFARFLGQARVVTFVPADLQLVSGGPILRRRFLNSALAQLSARYYRDLARYTSVIQQKAALLRGAVAPDRDLLLTYNDALVGPAAGLVGARADFVRELADVVGNVYGRWRGTSERLTVGYLPNVDPGAGTPEDAVRSAFAGAVEAELRRRTTLVGPHRDDVRFSIDGQPLEAYGSQGQQRTAVLALKVAEYETMLARTGDAPIVLLDDVLSELDADRAAGFLAAVAAFEQAFLTATEFPTAFAAAARYRVVAGTVTPC